MYVLAMRKIVSHQTLQYTQTLHIALRKCYEATTFD